MKSANVLAAASFLFASFVEAAPLNRRDMVVVTATQEVVETVELTTTVYVDDLPTAAPQPTTSAGGQFYEQPSIQPVSSIVEVQPTSIPEVPETSVAAATSTPVIPSIPEVSSTPVPTSTAQATSTVAEVSSVSQAPSSVYTPPAPSTTEVPTSVYVPIPSSVNIPATSVVPVPSASSVPNNSGSGTYTGDVTYYLPQGGLGSCGDPVTDDDMYVALGFDYNGSNEMCGKKITLYRDGFEPVTATVKDKCEGCKGASVDLTLAVWNAIASGIDGRGTISWSEAS